MDITTLRSIKALPENAVFGLISDSTKECYVSHTTNLRSRIGLILTDNDNILKEDTRLVVFGDIRSYKYKLLYAQYYLEKMVAAGYKNIGTSHSYINYKVKIEFSVLLNEVFVVLVNKRKDKLIVGVFKKMDDAQEFIDVCYREGEMVQPIYAINKGTVDWCSTNKVI